MAHNFSVRARKLAWSFSDEKRPHGITQIRRVGTDSTLNDDDSASIATSIQHLHPSDDIDEFVSTLKKDGCVIIDDFTGIQSLKQANKEVESWFNDQATPLIKQSPILRNIFFTNNMYQQLCEEFLAVETTRVKDGHLCTEICQPILSSAVATKLQSTNMNGQIHRHDSVLGIQHELVHKYRPGRDSMVGLIVPGSDGVHIQVALGSHLYGSGKPDFGKEVIEEELKEGQALIMLGSLYYHMAAQTTQQNAESALAYTMWSCAGIYRPEEQTAFMISAAEAKTYPTVVQQRLR